LLASGRTLAGRVNNLYNTLQQKIDDSNSAIASLSNQINTYANQIATLSESIARLESQNGQTANDLHDQREQTIAELNKLVNVTTVQQGSGELNVFIGNGQVLVAGGRANTFSPPVIDTNDPYNTSPASKLPVLTISGTSLTLDSGQIGGGELGGWLAVRNEVVNPALASLNRIAVAIGSEVNRVHGNGLFYDSASGAMRAGGDFFSGVMTQTGATVSAIGIELSTNRLANMDYTVSYDGANYTVTRVEDGLSTSVAAGTEITLGNVPQGFSIEAGTPAPVAGDTWTLNFQDYAHVMAAQISNIEKLASAGADNLVTAAASGNGGTASIGGASVSNPSALSVAAQVTLTFDAIANEFVVAGAVPAVANIAYASPGPQTLSFNGISLDISGVPIDGDVFSVIGPGSGDSRNFLALAALQTTGILDNGGATLSGAYNQLVSNGAALAAEADLNSQAFSTLTAQAREAQQAQSGVNLDEEAVNLIRYQQAYQAAAKAISVANALFDEILAIGR
jgi:flagellar hook-associated protein 1 FlgK